MNIRYVIGGGRRIAAIAACCVAMGGSMTAAGQVVEETVAAETEMAVEPDSTINLPVLIKGSEKQVLSDLMASWNTDWESVQLTGRVDVAGIGIHPTVRIYMVRGESILISVRVPLLGEQARVEVTKDRCLVVNKLKGVYWEGDPAGVLSADPCALEEIQAVLLGRVALPGKGEYRADMASDIDIRQFGEGYAVMEADADDAMPELVFEIGPTGRLQTLVGVAEGVPGTIAIAYSHSGDRMQLTATYEKEGSALSGTLQLDAPEWDSNGFSPVTIPSNYRKTSFRDVLRLK